MLISTWTTNAFSQPPASHLPGMQNDHGECGCVMAALGRYRIPPGTSFADFLAGMMPLTEHACHSLMRDADAMKAMRVSRSSHVCSKEPCWLHSPSQCVLWAAGLCSRPAHWRAMVSVHPAAHLEAVVCALGVLLVRALQQIPDLCPQLHERCPQPGDPVACRAVGIVEPLATSLSASSPLRLFAPNPLSYHPQVDMRITTQYMVSSPRRPQGLQPLCACGGSSRLRSMRAQFAADATMCVVPSRPSPSAS